MDKFVLAAGFALREAKTKARLSMRGAGRRFVPGKILREHLTSRELLTSMARMAEGMDFENLVACYYKPLYQFAFSLARNEAEACDLTQHTFCTWAAKGHQLRDATKVKTWLFTTLHREFLGTRRRQTRFPHVGLEHAALELPVVPPATASRLDAAQVITALGRLDEMFQAPVALFYLQDCSYNEIAEVLDVPIGTVKSRLARGLARLHQLLADVPPSKP